MAELQPCIFAFCFVFFRAAISWMQLFVMFFLYFFLGKVTIHMIIR
jgi:hypothetical protein